MNLIKELYNIIMMYIGCVEKNYIHLIYQKYYID